MGKTPLEAYQCIKIVMSDTKLIFQCTNSSYCLGEATITHGNEDDMEEPRSGSLTAYVKGDVFARAIAGCTGDVSLEIHDKSVTLKYPAGDYRIPTVHPDSIPVLPFMQNAVGMELDSKTLKHSLAVCAAVGQDCCITQDTDASVVVCGTRSDAFLTIAKLAGPGEVENPPSSLFPNSSALVLAAGCIGEKVTLSTDAKFACVESEEDGLFLRTMVARTAGHDPKLRLIRRLAVSMQTTILEAGNLAKAFSRAAVVTEAESQLCNLDILNDKIIISTRTGTGEAETSCQAACGAGAWSACIHAERAAAMLRPFSQHEPIDVFQASLQEDPLALRIVQGKVEMFIAQAARVQV